MLSYAGVTIGGVNVLQLYLKVTGNKTGLHQEDLNFCSVNINIGPAKCIWYFVPKEYWGALFDVAKKIGVDYFGRDWWPDKKLLRKYNITVYVVHQNAGDLIYTNVGTPHWVESVFHYLKFWHRKRFTLQEPSDWIDFQNHLSLLIPK